MRLTKRTDINLVLAWYDIWIGAYYDRYGKVLYLMIPFIGIKIQFGVRRWKKICTDYKVDWDKEFKIKP